MISENAFSRIHGQPDYKSCVELAGRDIAHINLCHNRISACSLRHDADGPARRRW